MKKKKQSFTKTILWLVAILALLSSLCWSGLSYAPQAGAKGAVVSLSSAKKTKESGDSKDSKSKKRDMVSINIKVGTKTFPAAFYDNETARAFIEKLPLSLNMSDLNRNEKYCRFDDPLPAATTIKPKTIVAGEIMLWSSDTIVLFYDSFDNNYGGYVKLGYIEDVAGLRKALGKGDVTVTFEKE